MITVHLRHFLVSDEEPLSQCYGVLTLEKQIINVHGMKVLRGSPLTSKIVWRLTE